MMITDDSSFKERRKTFWEAEEPTEKSMLQMEVYEELNKSDIKEVMAVLPDLKGKRVVELACGIGLVAS